MSRNEETRATPKKAREPGWFERCLENAHRIVVVRPEQRSREARAYLAKLAHRDSESASVQPNQ